MENFGSKNAKIRSDICIYIYIHIYIYIYKNMYSRGSRQSAYPSRRLCSGAWMFWILCTIILLWLWLELCVLAKCNVVRSWRRVALVAWGCPHNHVKTDSMRLKNVQVASFWAWKSRPEGLWRCLWDQTAGSPRPKCSQGRCAQFRQGIFGSKMGPNSIKKSPQKQDAEKFKKMKLT